MFSSCYTYKKIWNISGGFQTLFLRVPTLFKGASWAHRRSSSKQVPRSAFHERRPLTPSFSIKGRDYCIVSSPKVIQDFIVAWFSDSMRLSKSSVFFFSLHIAVNSVTLFLASEKVCYINSMGHMWTPDLRGEGRASCIRFLSRKERNSAPEASLSSFYMNWSAPWRQRGLNLQKGALLLAQAQ